MRAVSVLAKLSLLTAVAVAMPATVPSPGLAHHSFAAQFDVERPVTLEGTVTKVEWQNPHIWVYLDVAGPDGEVVPWECEGDNPNTLTRQGWTSESVEVGKPITIYGYQAAAGTPSATAGPGSSADRRCSRRPTTAGRPRLHRNRDSRSTPLGGREDGGRSQGDRPMTTRTCSCFMALSFTALAFGGLAIPTDAAAQQTARPC